MMHAVLHRAIAAKSLPPRARAVLAVVKPAHYLRLRREAAGLSIEEVASRLAPKERDRSIAADLVRTLERDGTTSRNRETIMRLAAIFPLDADVYFQLATEPASRHPRVCRKCGCSQNDACLPASDDIHGTACRWISPTLCSAHRR